MDASGNFVVTWTSYGEEDNGTERHGLRRLRQPLRRHGSPLSGEFQVNITTAGDQDHSTVSLSDSGLFVIAWESPQNGSDDDIFSRVFNADGSPYVDANGVGSPLTGERPVNQTTAGDQRYADVVMNMSGSEYVVTWQSSGQDGSGWGVYARSFPTSGNAGNEFQVNTTTAGDQMYPSLAMAADGPTRSPGAATAGRRTRWIARACSISASTPRQTASASRPAPTPPPAATSGSLRSAATPTATR